MTGASEFILNFVVNSAWQIPAVFLLAALGTYLLRNCAAQYRHTVWIAALFFSLIAPVITAVEIVPALPASSSSYSVNTTADDTDDTTLIDHTRRRSSQVVVNATPRNMRWIAAAYVLFLSFGAIRLARLWITNMNLRRSVSFEALTPPIVTSFKRCMSLFGVEKVQLGRSPAARVPYTLGIARPLIVLPDSFCGDVDEDTLLSVIGHEMAHVRRRDFLTKFVCELVSLPISFHPLTFFIKRQIERERELACDEVVTQQVLRPETYARSLLRAAALSLLPARRGMMLSVFDGRMLEERIRQLTRKRLSFSKWSGRIITAAVLGVLGVSSLMGSAFGFSLRTPVVLPAIVTIPASLVVASQEPTTDRPKQERPTTARRVDSAATQQSSDPEELAQAACEAGRNRDLEAVASLIALLGDDRKVEPIACWTSGRWSPALDTFKHPSPGEQAAIALASMGRAAFGPLTNQLTSPNAVTRRNAAWAIGELTNMVPGERAAAVPQLIVLLNDTDAWVRMAAARALGEVRDRRASSMLTAILGDADWRVRRLAAWALNEMKEERAVPALCDLLLRDSRVEVRVAAAEALGEIRSTAAILSLQIALNDAEPTVRAKASWAIAEIQ